MRLLLDTHVALWALISPEMLPERVRDLIADPGNDIHVSAASVWEIAIKFSLGRESGAHARPFSGKQAVGYFRQAGYSLLDITAAHAAAVEDLPALHADPFDRLIVAQSRSEPLHLVTQDRRVAAYGGTVITW